jgi:hypothetical protein
MKIPYPFFNIILMDLYTYTATNNPHLAKSLLHKFGYSANNVKTNEDLGICLRQLVSQEGESAFFDILENHPDKGVIIEMYNSQNKENNKKDYNSCSCCQKNYMNFSGQAENKPSSISKETSVFILASALILAAAIISKK